MPKEDAITSAWRRIENWLQANAPDTFDLLGKPSSDAAIDQFEKHFNAKLPAAVRGYWRRHDGASGSDLLPALEDDEPSYSPIGPKEAANDWRRLSREKAAGQSFATDTGVRAEYFNAKWIPIATNGGGDYHLVDLAPDKGGKAGQIIEWRHETNERRLVAPSLEALMSELAKGLESSVYVLDDIDGIVRAKGKPKPSTKAASAKTTRAKATTATPASSPKSATRALTKDDEVMLQSAHAAGPLLKNPDRGHSGHWEALKYTELLKAIDPRLQHFVPCRQAQLPALEKFNAPQSLTMFYENYAPKGGFIVNGIRLLSIEEMADATIELGVQKLVVMAINDAAGMRFAYDANRVDTSYRMPIVRIAKGVTPPTPRNKDPFKKDKALDALAPDAAAHIGDFLKKLASPKHRLNG